MFIHCAAAVITVKRIQSADTNFWNVPRGLLTRRWQPSSSPPVSHSASLAYLFVFQPDGDLPSSFLIHLNSRWIHCTFPGSCLTPPPQKKRKKREKKKKRSPRQRESVQGEESRVLSGARQEWKTFPLLSVSVFTRRLSLTPCLKPEPLEQPFPRS